MPAVSRAKVLILGAVALLAALAASGIHPYDRVTWVLEIFPVIILLPVLYATYRRFPLTSLLYGLIFLHALALMHGGAYTYARAPVGSLLVDAFGLDRNPYDKIGHFLQGLVPALAAREVLLRQGILRPGKMLVFLVLCVTLAISAAYELIEWAAALALGQGAEEFLGTQGYQWDTQSDMFFALLGAAASLLLFSQWHDQQLRKIEAEPAFISRESR